MVVARGEIWWADLPERLGSEPAGTRPVVVVQSDRFNRSRIGTVLVVPLTSTLALADAPGNVLLSRRESGLPKESVANVSQIYSLDRRRLREAVGALSQRSMLGIDNGLRLVLGL